jgi:hypothetical protein
MLFLEMHRIEIFLLSQTAAKSLLYRRDNYATRHFFSSSKAQIRRVAVSKDGSCVTPQVLFAVQ